MNASGTSRSIISDVEALMLKDMFDYSITLPSTYGTMYDMLNADGTLVIDMPDTLGGVSNDEVSIFVRRTAFSHHAHRSSDTGHRPRRVLHLVISDRLCDEH